MTIEQIKQILRDNHFSNPSDRIYWERKLAEEENKAIAYTNNELKRKEYEKGW